MDWSTRKVLNWRLSNAMHADFCVDAVADLVVPGRLRALCQTPIMEIIHRWTGQLLAGGKPGICIQFVELALDAEDGVEPFSPLPARRASPPIPTPLQTVFAPSRPKLALRFP